MGGETISVPNYIQFSSGINDLCKSYGRNNERTTRLGVMFALRSFVYTLVCVLAMLGKKERKKKTPPMKTGLACKACNVSYWWCCEWNSRLPWSSASWEPSDLAVFPHPPPPLLSPRVWAWTPSALLNLSGSRSDTSRLRSAIQNKVFSRQTEKPGRFFSTWWKSLDQVLDLLCWGFLNGGGRGLITCYGVTF